MTWMTQFDLAPHTTEAGGVLGLPTQCLQQHPIHHSDGDGLVPSIPRQTLTEDHVTLWAITFTKTLPH
jgi:hypothetical protein